MVDSVYDAFVSASKHDVGWVDTFLLPGLEAAGLKVCVPSRDFAVGVPELVNVERSIEHSRKILLVLTPNWIKSEWSAFEALMSQTGDPIGLRRRTLPLLLEDCAPPPRIKALTSADFRDSSQWPHQLKRVVKAVSEADSLGVLPERLEETIKLYIATNFDRDQYARLDQAGESDDRTTLLRKVFVDLHVKLRGGPQPLDHSSYIGELPAELFRGQSTGKPVSAMRTLLKDERFKVVIVGGPGQGKSTLGQYLAQAHRASLLGRQEEMAWHAPGLASARKQEYLPTLPRIPVRIILKYFAQWIDDHKEDNVTVESYIADQFRVDTSRVISSEEIHAVLRLRPVLLVFDGLDEVIEAGLRTRLLIQIQEFIQRAQHLRSNLQIIATSRPTGYSDQFSPEHFWHLELQPMSVEKVRDYAVRWCLAKVGFEEERRRILDTLSECQQEEHTKLLLTTPLQASIVLVIIKDGGRPPAQREGLFHDYWSTIFRRERAKGKGIIRSEETLLFGLHAFLGYILHRKALRENVRSLLSRSEFESYVIEYLRANDRRARPKAIKERAIDIVQEATGRLVLLVDPEPGLFGFELRSIQEFFAAAYLSQSARDTRVRFLRLRAIALSEHWRNVALFFAGRVMRNYSGEAANILELVCRPIDRDKPDAFLRRGAWLALDIAADGALSNRDLQYGAIEHALTVLDEALPRAKHHKLYSAIARLPSEDRREIVRPIIQRRIRECGRPCDLLANLLELLIGIPGAKRTLLEGLEVLVQGSERDKFNAFRFAVRFRADPAWLAREAMQYWDIFLRSGAVWWGVDIGLARHMQEVVGLLPITSAQAIQLANAIAKSSRQVRGAEPLALTLMPNSIAEQVVAFRLCLYFVLAAERGGGPEIRLLGLVMRSLAEPESLVGKGKLYSRTELRTLLQRQDLLPNLRLALWSIFWILERPRGEAVEIFMNDVQSALASGVDRELLRILRFDLRWPLLGAAVRLIYEGQRVSHQIMQALREDRAASASTAVQEYLVNLARTLEPQEWIEFLIELRSERMRNIEKLAPIAGLLGITQERLIRMHVRFFPGVNLSEEQTLVVIRIIEDRLRAGLGAASLVTMIDSEVVKRPKVKRALASSLLRICKSDKKTQDLVSVASLLFVLAEADSSGLRLSLIKAVCKLVGQREEFLWRTPVRVTLRLPLAIWGEVLRSRDVEVKRGVIRFWVGLQELLDDSSYLHRSPIKAVVFRWEDLERCFDIPSIPKANVIRLLTSCAVPIDLPSVQDSLLAMIRSATPSEAIAWQEFLMSPWSAENSSIHVWPQFLERILEERHAYSPSLYSSALEGYGSLIGLVATGNLTHEDELELPRVGSSREE